MKKDMSGSLSRNKRKEKTNHPDQSGSCVIGGVEYWISGWKKHGDGGEPWVSLAFKPKQAVGQPKAQEYTPKAKPTMGSDEDWP